MAILRAEKLVKVYGRRRVVNDIDIEAKTGEIVGLLGPNGAGKTTTFYMITGMIRPNQGKIFLEDEDITGMPMYKRAQKGIGYLAQEASVFRKLSVEDNLRLVLEMYVKDKKEIRNKIDSLIDEPRSPELLRPTRNLFYWTNPSQASIQLLWKIFRKW